MSHVTDIAIVAPLGSEDAIAIINAWLDAEDYGTLVGVSQHGGGNKAHQWAMWSGAFNYLDLTKFSEMITAIPVTRWGYCEYQTVLILIQDEHDHGASVVPLHDLTATRSLRDVTGGWE